MFKYFFLITLLSFLLNQACALEPAGNRKVESYFFIEMTKSVSMIEANTNGSREDFLSSFGYDQSYKKKYSYPFNQKYKNTFFCANETIKGVIIEFSLTSELLILKIFNNGSVFEDRVVLSDNVLFDKDEKRFFINGEKIKAKGFMHHREKGMSSISWIRFMLPSGKVCGVSSLNKI